MAAPVLVVGVVPRIAVAIARSLHRIGVPVDVAGLSPSEPRVVSRAVRDSLRLPEPRPSPTEFTRALLEAIRDRGYDMLIPGNDQGLTAIAERYDAVPSGVRPGCPPPGVVVQHPPEAETLHVAGRLGIPVPVTHGAADVADLERLRHAIAFPVVAKSRDKARPGLEKARYFRSWEELHAAFAESPAFGEEHLLQEYCRGEGVGLEILMSGGHPLVAFQHRRLREYPATGGVSSGAVSEACDPALAAFARALLRALEWDGPAMVEFKQDVRTGRVALMEVNGRFWGSLALPIQVGIDFPLYVWQLAHGRMPRVPEGYASGRRMRWLAGDVRRLHAAALAGARRLYADGAFWREAAWFVRECLPPTRDALWSWRDPLPALCEAGQTIGQLASGDVHELVGLARAAWAAATGRRGPAIAGRATATGLTAAERRPR